MRRVDKLVVHHTASKDTNDLDVANIRRFHTENNRWSDIGYHFLIDKINGTYEAIVGRPIHRQGAHVRGHNRNSVGIAVVGNFETEHPKDEMYDVLIGRVVIPLHHLFPKAKIYAHNELAATKCPGSNFDINRIKAAL